MFWTMPITSEWGTVESFDHRTLQGAHDLLAAVWRFRNDFRQSELPFVNKNSLDEVQELWLDWLRQRDFQLAPPSGTRPLGSVDPDEPEQAASGILRKRSSPSTSSTGFGACRGTRD